MPVEVPFGHSKHADEIQLLALAGAYGVGYFTNICLIQYQPFQCTTFQSGLPCQPMMLSITTFLHSAFLLFALVLFSTLESEAENCCNCTSVLARWSKAEYFANACTQCALRRTLTGRTSASTSSSSKVQTEDGSGIKNFVRKDLAVQCGITSACFVAALGGVVEYGFVDSDHRCPQQENVQIPEDGLLSAFQDGCCFAIFWRRRGDKFVAVADYILPGRTAFLRQQRGDDVTFVSESKGYELPASGDNLIAQVARSGKELLIDPSNRRDFKRSELAKKFRVESLRFIPCQDGVLECGRASEHPSASTTGENTTLFEPVHPWRRTASDGGNPNGKVILTSPLPRMCTKPRSRHPTRSFVACVQLCAQPKPASFTYSFPTGPCSGE